MDQRNEHKVSQPSIVSSHSHYTTLAAVHLGTNSEFTYAEPPWYCGSTNPLSHKDKVTLQCSCWSSGQVLRLAARSSMAKKLDVHPHAGIPMSGQLGAGLQGKPG